MKEIHPEKREVGVTYLSTELLETMDALLGPAPPAKYAILVDMLWKLAREDWHGVSDAANDLRALHL